MLMQPQLERLLSSDQFSLDDTLIERQRGSGPQRRAALYKDKRSNETNRRTTTAPLYKKRRRDNSYAGDGAASVSGASVGSTSGT